MTVGYRAMLSRPAKTDAIATVEQQLHSWLLEKKRNRRSSVRLADWSGPGVHTLGHHATLTVVHADAGGERRRTFRLREENDDGVWVVSVHVLDRATTSRDGDAVVIELALLGADEEDAVRASSVPKLVRYLLEVEPASTGGGTLALTATPQLIEAEDIPSLVAALEDPARTAAVIIAASPDQASQSRWIQVIGSLTRESVGIASVLILGSMATEELNQRLLPSHQVRPGFVRTFVPGARFDDLEDGRRHPFLTPARLLRSMTGNRVAEPLQRVHASTLRQRALQQPVPRDIRRALDLLSREEQRVLRDTEVDRRVQSSGRLDARLEITEAETDQRLEVTASGPSATTADRVVVRWPRRLLALIRAWLPKHAEQTVESDEALEDLHRFIEVQVSEKQVALEQLDEAAEQDRFRLERIAQLGQRIEDLQLDLAVQEEEARKSARRAQIYEDRLREANRYAELYIESEDEVWAPPDSVATLVDRLNPELSTSPAVEYVVFTGDRDVAIEVDVRDTLNRYAVALWDFVHVLYDYASLKSSGEFAGNVHMYLTSDCKGAKCSPARHAATESDTVLSNRAMAAERIRPVPVSVNPAGEVLMAAHFKPTHSDTFAPRMHYFDDTDRSGKVYIGYVGRHLTNTRTN